MKIKNKFNKEGYIKIDTDIKSNPKFAYISKKFDFFLNKEINKESSKKLGGYIMGNLSMQQGYLGNILFKLLFTSKFVSKIESLVENKLTEYKSNIEALQANSLIKGGSEISLISTAPTLTPFELK